jgi:hypothetical protein
MRKFFVVVRPCFVGLIVWKEGWKGANLSLEVNNVQPAVEKRALC